MEARLLNHFHGKAISITYSERVYVALVIQHAKSMRRIILSSVAWELYQIFQRCLINGTIFGEKVIECKMCVLIFSTTLSKTFLNMRKI
jgi:hypothetical protein